VFYLRYHYYRIYFPLLALARWANLAGVEGDCPNFRASENGTVPFDGARLLTG
jgi:hypothetical protein